MIGWNQFFFQTFFKLSKIGTGESSIKGKKSQNQSKRFRC